jgi:hypothetical protein
MQRVRKRRLTDWLILQRPCHRAYQARGRQMSSRRDRARQAVWLVRRWLPTSELVVVGDQT